MTHRRLLDIINTVETGFTAIAIALALVAIALTSAAALVVAGWVF